MKTVPKEMMQPVMEAYDMMERYLQKHNYVARDSLSIADFSVVATMTSMMHVVPMEMEKYPKIMAWMKKMEMLPVYEENQKGLDMMMCMMKKMR